MGSWYLLLIWLIGMGTMEKISIFLRFINE